VQSSLGSRSTCLKQNLKRFKVYTAVTIMMMFFWVWAPCGLAGRSQPHPMGPEKGLTSPTTDACLESLPIGPAQSLPHSVLIGPFLQTSLTATLYNPSDSQHRHFSPEDGDSTLLRNVGFYQPVHTAPKPRGTSSKFKELANVCLI
jgi:hypothetical protein